MGFGVCVAGFKLQPLGSRAQVTMSGPGSSLNTRPTWCTGRRRGCAADRTAAAGAFGSAPASLWGSTCRRWTAEPQHTTQLSCGP